MSKVIITGILLALATTGCNERTHHDDSLSSYQQTAPLKPIVTLVPVINSTKSTLPWDLSTELTSAIDYRLASNNDLFLVDLNKTYATVKKLKNNQNPFGLDTSWIKRTFTDEEFVVFLELIEHEEILRQDKKQPGDPKLCSADLNIGVRVRIFDVRGDQPKVILQELIHHSHFIPRPFTQINFCQASWGDESFSISPMGLAHTALTKEITKRIQEYILISSTLK
jgi:hypothetical protein